MRKILLSLLVIGAVGGTVFAATNAFFSDTETSNGNTFTAGSLDLKVDSTATYNGNTVASSTWALKDLNPTSDKFFNFSDVKPGDRGENTISLHIINNDAWACVDIKNYSIVPGTSNQAMGTGKLGDELQFFAWNDINGDNIFEPGSGETKLFTQTTGIGNASDVLGGKTYTLADSVTGTPMSGGPLNDSTKTHYVGLAWCAGKMTVDLTTGAISCDGSTMGNEAQGDSMSADIAFRVVQSRNNPNFKCSNASDQTVFVNGQTLSLQTWFGYNDETDTVDNSLVSFVLGPSTPPAGAGSAQMTVSGTQRRNLATTLLKGTKLSDISSMKFSTFWPVSQPGSNRDIYLNFNVSFDGTNTWQKRLAYVPAANGSVTPGAWQTWDTTNGLWWWSGFSANGNKWPDGSTVEYRTWSDILATNPNIKMNDSGFGWLGFRAGEPYADGFTGQVDKFEVTINGNHTVYDFGQ